MMQRNPGDFSSHTDKLTAGPGSTAIMPSAMPLLILPVTGAPHVVMNPVPALSLSMSQATRMTSYLHAVLLP